ncbi:MBL fold metallo-hydrolase [Amycolatopsis sp. H20-H5]|uniref:MBL fold metallo-hydrolase n=1 Tax=Amycolatopsis sp. H20-H5 TaxID=3046309 RepID=UPI002DB61981|nr:MBL fold metallo-hydrolase [Amycolatopsis sp. H20-H5]MEC3980324.1 MBL fold metallo-hydrolase [Amycolatopsis sp. H20-H5]
METLTLLPNLHLFRFAVGRAYLWADGEALTLIDTGTPGSAEAVLDGIERLGDDPARLERIVLTHFHGDHTGSAADRRPV